MKRVKDKEKKMSFERIKRAEILLDMNDICLKTRRNLYLTNFVLVIHINRFKNKCDRS